ncbi:hypothetical protein E2974_15980 [Paracoccus yeei]|uniref:hypothetical protein n=1 Tax=Paracoccus yeei TaxID=147645 RepID=UPI0037D42889
MKIPTLSDVLAILENADPDAPVRFSDGLTPVLGIGAMTRPDVPRSLVLDPTDDRPTLAGDFSDWLDFIEGTPFFDPAGRPQGRVSRSSPLVYDRSGGLVVERIIVDDGGCAVTIMAIEKGAL